MPKMPTKNTFYADSLLKVRLHHSSKIKVIKNSQNNRNQRFASVFLLGSGSRSRTRRPKKHIDPAPAPALDPEHCLEPGGHNLGSEPEALKKSFICSVMYSYCCLVNYYQVQIKGRNLQKA